MQKVSFYTLGCKLNQAETSFLQDEFEKQGYHVVPFGEPCDLCVINTCTVTSRTEYKCRQVIRKAIKHAPESLIAVVGCYAQMSSEHLSKIPGVKLILGSDQKFEIFKYLKNGRVHDEIVQSIGTNEKFIHAQPGSHKTQTRAFLKIQDGCNNFCSYCIVPYARGRSRSALGDNVVENIKQLIDKGYKEIVLTGVHIGKYGKDLTPSISLLDILKRIVTIEDLGRIRLSSLEPLEIVDELIEFAANSPKMCPHFHIPLQSGDDSILTRMNRNYTVAQFTQVIEKIGTKIPMAGLGTDIIVGFPGEKDQHFENTLALVKNLPFSYFHVFAFSIRPGTKASEFPDMVHPNIKKNRSTILISMGKQKKTNFYKNAVGKQFKVLIEEKTGGKWMYGFTENYIRVKVPKKQALFNEIVSVEIIGIDGEFAVGRIIV